MSPAVPLNVSDLIRFEFFPLSASRTYHILKSVRLPPPKPSLISLARSKGEKGKHV